MVMGYLGYLSIGPSTPKCNLTLERAAMSDKLYFGFPIVSTKIAFVLSSIAFAYSAGSSEVTNFAVMPNFLNETGRGRYRTSERG